MIRKIAAAFATVLVAFSMLRGAKQIDEEIYEIDDELREFELLPGAWFKVYLSDWMEAHDIDDHSLATSGIARGDETNDYIWATETPEWDRDWFNSHGWTFPRKWVPYHFLHIAAVDGDTGDYLRLRGL